MKKKYHSKNRKRKKNQMMKQKQTNTHINIFIYQRYIHKLVFHCLLDKTEMMIRIII